MPTPFARHRPLRLVRLAALGLPIALALALSLGACANTVDHSAGGLDAGDDSGGFQIDANGDVGLDPDAACGAVRVQAQTFPLNLYVMLDKSASMDGPKWNAAKAGLAAFVNDARSSGIRVAINFFPRVIDPMLYRQKPLNAQ